MHFCTTFVVLVLVLCPSVASPNRLATTRKSIKMGKFGTERAGDVLFFAVLLCCALYFLQVRPSAPTLPCLPAFPACCRPFGLVASP